MKNIKNQIYVGIAVVCFVLAQGCSPKVKGLSPIALTSGMDLSIFKQQVMNSTDQSVHSTVTNVNNTSF